MKIKIDWKLLWKSVKEPLREVVMAIIPFVLAYLQALPAQWAIVLYLVLRGIDSWLHEKASVEPVKTRNDGIGGVTGLTGF